MGGEPHETTRPVGAPPAAFLGVSVEFYDALGSTNDELLRRAAEGAPEGLVVVAGRQTAGRGRMGRSWWDAPGASLLFSVLLRPTIEVSRWPLLGIAMACAVGEAGGKASGAPLEVKWPNDVLHQGRKLCGVLAESRVPSPGAPALVIGAGINVNQGAGDFPPEIRERATSLRVAAGGAALDLGALLAATLERFGRYREVALAEGADALLREIAPRLPAPGTPVRVLTGERRVTGVVEGVTQTGALRVRQDADGSVVTVTAGELA
jgi:BirA family biotin operon repressor/biotin-[acetyl-CoA-carboxylase] ligase